MLLRHVPLFGTLLVTALSAHCTTLSYAWKSREPYVLAVNARMSAKGTGFRGNECLLSMPRGGGEQSNDDANNSASSDDVPVSLRQPTDTTEETTEIPLQEETLHSPQREVTTLGSTSSLAHTAQAPKARRTSDVIVHLLETDSALNEESLELRQFISNRAQAYVEELSSKHQGNDSSNNNNKLPHPKRVLHSVAPKIPAIKQSPDLMLRVQSFKGGTDTGVAACAIGTIARLCESYDRTKRQRLGDGTSDDINDDEVVSVGAEVVRDRRFQQLVELVLCGVDINKRKQEAEELRGNETSSGKGEARDMEDVLDEEHAEMGEGLSVQDACRAAWGIAVLAGFHTQTVSDTATHDILTALALRSKELLLARLQLLREGDAMNDDNDGAFTLVQRLDKDAEELAQAAASAMWTFACVKACTGVRSVALFETCCAILCQNPVDLRERALEAKEGIDGSNFQVNDVIDKLERSELKDFTNGDATNDDSNITLSSSPIDNTTECSSAPDTSNDSLLDWLSPNEVTDVLWALALHGSTVDADSKEEVALSETAAAFREIAFDRLVGWLRRDLDITTEVKNGDTNSPAFGIEAIEKQSVEVECSDDVSLSGVVTENGEVVVEVVDAAALLASSIAPAEAEVVKNNRKTEEYAGASRDVEVRHLQAADADTLLASAPESVDLETETIVTPATVSTEAAGPVEHLATSVANIDDSSPECSPDEGRSRNNPQVDMTTFFQSGMLCFSPHDLCSIAWAVTDLRDPLRYLIVDLIAQTFANFGRDSLETLTMADLSNLAWAIARAAPQKQALTWSEYSETPAAIVAESVMARLGIDGQKGLDDHHVSVAVRSVVREFQPPELGRLMWSLACSVSNYIDPFERMKERDGAVSQLSAIALLAAGSNLSIFSTEDLTRISWAFLELCDTKEALSQPLVAESLGRTLSVIEASLLAWERGPLAKQTPTEMKRAEDSLHFSTFFGKSRFPLPLLNQMIHEHEDEDEGPAKPRKVALPLLRDLPVDPASLCKLSSGFSRLSQEQRSIVGGWTFVRVAVRLLSSKNGQLMERCPLIDVIGLCHACAISEVNGRERGQVVRLFAGRVVLFMNDALDPDRNAHGKASERLGRVSPWEISTLLWSLGELGVRHCESDENRQMAHRKLRLVTDRPLLSDSDLQSLSAASTLNLLHGIVSMEMTSSDPSFIRKVLQACEAKVQSLGLGRELVDLSQIAAKVKQSVERLEQQSADDLSLRTKDNNSSNYDGSESDNPRNKTSSSSDELAPNEHNSTIIKKAILESADRILTAVADTATGVVRTLSATEMRELLSVYAVLPFHADGMVSAIEKETIRRLEVLGFKGPLESVQDLARGAFETSLLTSNILSGQSQGGSPAESIKDGIKAIFGVHEVSEEESNVDVARLAAFAENARRTTTLTRETLGRMEQIRQGTGEETESLFKGAEQGTALELGRCSELIACYRRIDFSTGTQRSRYDSVRRRDISKRILSRLFP